MEKLIEKSNEISDFIGLLIIELHQYVHQFCIHNDYMDIEIRNDIKNICNILRTIQKDLKNPFEYSDETKNMLSNFIYNLDKEYYHPTGYSFVIKAMNKKLLNFINKLPPNENILSCKALFTDLETFFEKLGNYLNEQHFWRYS
jgi:hypothetical protein